VNDLADVLPAERERRLEERLAAFERETSHQIVLLTVPSLEGDPIERFSMRVAEAWRIGHAGLDNGIIVIVVPRDREARVEVGYGLEGVVPDAIASRVLRERMFPHFREGRMADGVEAGIEALVSAARGAAIPEARRPRSRGAPGAGDLEALWPIVLFCGLLGSMLSVPLRRKSRLFGAGLGGLAGGGLAYLLAASLLAAGGAGALAFLLGLNHPTVLRPGRGGLGRWGDYGGGFGGGGSEGGFSGGGGGFGGGGASGRW
jgi:uncharacterized protein